MFEARKLDIEKITDALIKALFECANDVAEVLYIQATENRKWRINLKEEDTIGNAVCVAFNQKISTELFETLKRSKVTITNFLTIDFYKGKLFRIERAMINDTDADDPALINFIATELERVMRVFTTEIWCGTKATETSAKKIISEKCKRLLAFKKAAK